jgi:hypothetical protein
MAPLGKNDSSSRPSDDILPDLLLRDYTRGRHARSAVRRLYRFRACFSIGSTGTPSTLAFLDSSEAGSVYVVTPALTMSVSPTSATGGGTCPNIIDSALGCAPSERVTWALGTLAAGEERTVSVPPVVANTTRPGAVIVFDALASYPDDRNAGASGTLRVRLP